MRTNSDDPSPLPLAAGFKLQDGVLMNKLLIMLLMMILITGCSAESSDFSPSSSDVSKKSIATKEEKREQNPPKKNAVYVSNPQVTDDTSLTNIGDSFSDEKGEAVLKAFKKSGEKLTIGPVEMTIRNAKVITYTPDYSLIDFFHGYTHDETFDFVKVFVTIKNNSDHIVRFAPVALLETDSGEKKTWEDDIYLEELNGKLNPGEVKQGNLGFIIEKADFDSIALTTSKVFTEKDDEVAKEYTAKIDF